MKRLTLILMISSTVSLVIAQSTNWEWAESVPQMGETSTMRGIAADEEGNSLVIGNVTEPYGSNVSGLYMVKYDPNGAQLWSYSIKGSFGTCDAVFDADQNVYAIIKYTQGVLVVEGDSVEESDFALVKLDSEGQLEYVKAVGSDGLDNLYAMRIENDELLVSAFGLTSFNREGISYTIPLFGRPYIMAFELNGELKYSAISSMSYLDEPSWLTNENGTYISYVPKQNVVKFRIDSTTETPPTIAELDLVNQVNGFELKVTDVQLSTNNMVFASGYFKSDYVLLEGDTIYNKNAGFPTCFILKMDTGLKVLDYSIYYDSWGIQNQDVIQRLSVFKNEKIAVKSWFAFTMYFENDSLISNNNQRAAAVMEFDQDLNLTTAAQVNSWDEGGWKSWDMEYDGLGNLFCLFTHEEDIIYDSLTIESFNKSWEHLSVLSKLGTGETVGLVENAANDAFRVYPNPTKGQLFIESSNSVKELICLDLNGQPIQLNIASGQIDLSNQANGIYVLAATLSDGSVVHQKIIKTN